MCIRAEAQGKLNGLSPKDGNGTAYLTCMYSTVRHYVSRIVTQSVQNRNAWALVATLCTKSVVIICTVFIL